VTIAVGGTWVLQGGVLRGDGLRISGRLAKDAVSSRPMRVTEGGGMVGFKGPVPGVARLHPVDAFAAYVNTTRGTGLRRWWTNGSAICVRCVMLMTLI
jgi:hypothetical protein